MGAVKKALVISALAAAAATGTAAPASASTGGQCNGTVDYGCFYCSYAGGSQGHNPYYCSHPTQYPGYVTVACTVWYGNYCYVG